MSKKSLKLRVAIAILLTTFTGLGSSEAFALCTTGALECNDTPNDPGTTGYYREIATMVPNLMSGAGLTLDAQVQAANGNLEIINKAFQNAIQYAIRTGNLDGAAQAVEYYDTYVRPALERQYALTSAENPNNLTVMNNALENGLNPALQSLNTLLSAGSAYGSSGGFVATPNNVQQLATIYNTLNALQGDKNALAQLGGQYYPGYNQYGGQYGQQGNGDFNLLNVLQGVSLLTNDRVTDTGRATGASAIINSLGLDSNVAGPLSMMAGLVLDGDNAGRQIAGMIGGITSGLPQATGMIGQILGNVMGGGNSAGTGAQIQGVVTSQILSGMLGSSRGQSIPLPNGMKNTTAALTTNVSGAVDGAKEITKKATTDAANVPNKEGVETTAGGGSPNAEADAERIANGESPLGTGSSCSSGAVGPSSAAPASQNADNSITGPRDGETARDYMLRESGSSSEDVDAFFDNQGLNPSSPAIDIFGGGSASAPKAPSTPLSEERLEKKLEQEWQNQLTTAGGSLLTFPASREYAANIIQGVFPPSYWENTVKSAAINQVTNQVGGVGGSLLGGVLGGSGIGGAATAAVKGVIGSNLTKVLTSNPAVSSALSSSLGVLVPGIGGALGVPAQIMKGGFYTVVENILSELRKQTIIGDELCRIARRQEKAQFEDDPAAAVAVKEATKKSDDEAANKAQEQLITNLQDRIEKKVAQDLKEFVEKDLKGANVCAPLKSGIDAFTKTLLEVSADRAGAFKKSFNCPPGVEEVLAKAYKDGNLAGGWEEFLLANQTSVTPLGKQLALQERITQIVRERRETELVQFAAYQGYAPQTNKDKEVAQTGGGGTGGGASGGGTGGGAPTPPPRPEQITVPGGQYAEIANKVNNRPAEFAQQTKTEAEDKAGLADQVKSGETVQRLSGQTPSKTVSAAGIPGRQPGQPGQTGAGGTDWQKLLSIGLTAYCIFDADSSICGGGGGRNNNQPATPPANVEPRIVMVSGTSNRVDKQATAITWATEGMTSCRFSTDWLTFGSQDVPAFLASPLIRAGTPAQATDTKFIYQPHVFSFEIDISEHIPGELEMIPLNDGVNDEMLAEEASWPWRPAPGALRWLEVPPTEISWRIGSQGYRTRLQKVFPAPGFTQKTVLIQETTYIPKLENVLSRFDMSVILNGQTLVFRDISLAEATSEAIATGIAQGISALPASDAFRQEYNALHMSMTALNGELVVRGDKLLDGQLPTSGTYELTCTPARGGAEIKKSVTIPFASDSIIP